MQEYAYMAGLAAPLMPRDDFTLGQHDTSDRGNAERFIARHGDRFLFVRSHGWFVYTGTHWTKDDNDIAIRNAATATAAAIELESSAFDQEAKRSALAGDEIKASLCQKRAQRLRKWMTTSGNDPRLKGMLSVAQAKLAADLKDFDTDGHTLNVQNGTLRFFRDSSGRWQVRCDDHDPADRLSRVAAFSYNPTAEAPVWDTHLQRSVPNLAEREFLMRTLGYCLLGLTDEQVFFIWQGRGGDGKSVTAGAVRRVLGSYAAKIDVRSFLEDRTGRNAAQASPDIARLAGATRFVVASEPPKGARLNEALVKEFTGGAPLLARHLNKEPFEFNPRFRLLIDCNPLPTISGPDDGIWRRVVLIPWREQLKREQMDPTIEEKIVRDGEGVLASLVRSALSYLERGLKPPDTIVDAQASYKAGANLFRDWLDAFCVRDDKHETRQSNLYSSYASEMERQGQDRPMTNIAFGRTLDEMQVLKLRDVDNNVARRGLRLRTDAERAALAVKGSGIVRHFSINEDESDDAGRNEPLDADSWEYEGD